MKDAWKQFEEKLKRDWIKGCNFEALLNHQFTTLGDRTWRKLLYQYAFNYYDYHHADWLDEAFIFIEEELEDPKNRTLLKEELFDIQQEIRYTQGENSWSLSAIAEAVEPLLYKDPLSKNSVRKAINHILFAYSCHSDASVFLEREDAYLCQLFLSLTNS
ncbi:MAG: hypothetical protein ACRBFS_22755 [Aureispira sp.]